jgi:hypothetical protein
MKMSLIHIWTKIKYGENNEARAQIGGRSLTKNKLIRRIHRDEKGALEGLPLYLIILVVIAAVAIVVIMAWMGSVQDTDLESIEIAGTETDGTLVEGETYSITITAKGNNGKNLEGVSVEMEGAGITKTLKTQSDGTVTFTGITPDLPANTFTGEITITAKYTGTIQMTKTGTIPVNAD